MALLEASQTLGAIRGENILRTAIQEPFTQILENADMYDKLTVKNGDGYNTETGKLCNMIESGIIDPANVVKAAVSNAVSSALMVSNLGGSVNLVRKVKDNKESDE